MTPLEEIETKIRKLCPELQELSMWCIVKKKAKLCTVIAVYTDTDDEYTECIFSKGIRSQKSSLHNNVFTEKMFSEDEILWHPIHLEHILKCLWPHAWIDWAGFFIYLGLDEWDYFYAYQPHLSYASQQYDLSLPLNQQSEEIIAFLNSVIK